MRMYDFSLIKQTHPITGRSFLCYKSDFTNLYDTLLATARRLPDKVAMVDDCRAVTWSEFLHQVDALSAALRHDFGIRPGDRVGILMMNSTFFCAAFYAVTKLGAIAVVLNTKNAAPELEWMLNDTEAVLLFSDAAWEQRIAHIISNTQIKSVIFGQDAPPIPGVQTTSCEAIFARPAMPELYVHRDVFAPAMIMYTSGTTGSPKGALISHFNILQNVFSYEDVLQLDDTECTVIGVPLFHITGLSCLMALFVYIGGKMVLVPKFHAAEVNALMLQHGATHIHAVPSIYTMLYDAQPDDRPISTLRSAVCGGGSIAPHTIRSYCQKTPNVSFHCAYGMTETAGAGVLAPTHYFEAGKEGASGIVVPNAEIHIVDDQGQPLPAGSIGEICFGGSVVIDHYWKKPDTVGFHNNWLMSGDIGKVDADGYVYIVDRKKDMINRSGEKIFSILVEKELYGLKDVDFCAVFPVYDAVHGEVPAAYVTLHPWSTLTAEEIRAYLLTRLAKFEVPKYIEIVDSIPLNPNNKVSKHQLRKQLENQLHLL